MKLQGLIAHIVVLASLLLSAQGWAAAPILDSTNAAIGFGFTGATLDITYTTVSLTNPVSFVCAGAGDATSSTTHASGVVHGSDTYTELPSSFRHDGWDGVSVWYKINPTIQAAATLTITFPAAPSITSGIAFVYSLVDQTTPFGTAALNNGSSTAPTVTVTSGVVDDVIVGCLSSDSASGITEGGTLIKEQQNIEGDTSYGAEAYAGSTSQAVAWTQAENTGWAVVGWSIKQVSGGGGPDTKAFYKRRIQ